MHTDPTPDVAPRASRDRRGRPRRPWRARTIAGLVSLVLVASACGDDDDDGATAEGASTPSSAATAGTNDTATADVETPDTEASASSPDEPTLTDEEIRIAVPSALLSLDPGRGGNIRLDASVHSAIYRSLTTIDPQLELVGDLATAWSSPEPGTWRFELEPGAVFENGNPLDANTVVANFDRLFAADSALAGGYDLKPQITSYTAVDDVTLEITTNTPYLDLPRRLSYLFFIDPIWAEEGHSLDLEANASGPYRVVSYNPEVEAVLERNDAYAGDPAPYGRARYVVLASPAARVAALLAGEVDASIVIDPPDLAQLEDAGLQAGAIESNRNHMVRLNSGRPPFDDLRVRQAVNYAIDKEAITQAIFLGTVEPSAGQVFNSLYEALNPDLEAFPYDPDRARELLAEAGYADGFEVTLDVPTGTYVGVDLIVQVLAAQLAEVGVTVNLNVLQFAAWRDSAGSVEGPDSTYVGYNSGDNSTTGILNYFTSDFVQNHTDNPAYDAIFQELRQATTEDEAIEISHRATQEMYDFAHVLFLFPQPQTYALAEGVDWIVRPDDWLRAQDFSPAG